MASLAALPTERRVNAIAEWEERAAHMEVDAEVPRAEAELAAAHRIAELNGVELK